MRNKTIDIIKGIAIFLVVLGHVIQFRFLPESFDENYLFRMIYSFHMPLFMFLSGYLVWKESLITVNLQKKFRRLIIPFFVWGGISYFLGAQYKNIILSEFLFKLMWEPDTGLWFLWVLFLNFLILQIGLWGKRFPIKEAFIWISLIIILWLVPVKAFGINATKWYFIFFLLGMFTNRYKDKALFVIKKVKYKILTIIMYLAFSFMWYRTNRPQEWYISQKLIEISNSVILGYIILFAYKAVTAILGILFIYILVRDNRNVILNNIFSCLGKYSLEIYCMHFFLLSLGIYEGYLSMFFSTVFILLINILIAIILKKSKLIGKILFGY